MKTLILHTLIIIAIIGNKISAQQVVIPTSEKYGNTLNVGIGLGYYGYVGRTFPVVHLNYELDVAKRFTLAPFLTYYSYQNNYYWGNNKYPYKNYYYQQTAMLVGVKGTYYFDDLLKANSKWDFYLAASVGFAFRKTTWDNDYYGDRYIQKGSSGLYLDGHIGTEYHLNKTIGLTLDLSTGISTFGLAIHL